MTDSSRAGRRRGGFWTSLPALVGATAALITALATVGVITSRNQADGSSGTPPSAVSAPSSTAVLPPATDPPAPDPPAPDPPAPDPPAPSPTEPAAAFTLQVGIRPDLGQTGEEIELLVDGEVAASWTADESTATQFLQVPIGKAGQHKYELRGSYSWLDPISGAVLQDAVRGSGSINVADGDRLGVLFNAGRFSLVQI
jgi:cytoskeletal protein RodZ